MLDLGLVQLEADEIHLQLTAVIRDRRNVIESFPESLIQEPLVGILLHLDQVGHIQNFFPSGIAHTHAVPLYDRSYSVLFHTGIHSIRMILLRRFERVKTHKKMKSV